MKCSGLFRATRDCISLYGQMSGGTSGKHHVLKRLCGLIGHHSCSFLNYYLVVAAVVQITMESLNNLASSLPTSNLANAEKDVLNNFKCMFSRLNHDSGPPRTY